MGFLDRFRKTQAPPAPVKQTRGDSWVNPYTGFGTTRDKLTSAFYLRDTKLTFEELTSLYYGDYIAEIIVSHRPEEAFREGYKVDAEGEETGKKLQEAGEKLNLDQKVLEAWIFARLFGGSLLYAGIDDGGLPTDPVVPEKIKAVKYINWLDCRFVSPGRYYTNPLSPKFGEVEIWRISPGSTSIGTAATVAEIHESRCVPFIPVLVDPRKRAELNGWSYSVLQRCYDVMRMFASSVQSAGLMLTDASQGVFKIKDLISMISSGEKGALQDRMQLVDMARSSARSVLIDSDTEEFTKLASSFAGVPEMLDRFMNLVSAASREPVSILFGRSAAGMNATGEGDFQGYYDSISKDQENFLEPKLKTVYGWIAQAELGQVPKDLDICFESLWAPTEKEQAETYNTLSQGDTNYYNMGALKPEQIALARFAGGGTVSLRAPEVDVPALEAALLEPDVTFETPKPTDPNAPSTPADPNAQPDQKTTPSTGAKSEVSDSVSAKRTPVRKRSKKAL